MKLTTKSEWYLLDSPIGEPSLSWDKKNKYNIERVVQENGDIIWFGLNVNWKKIKGGNWTVLTDNPDAKPLQKYLPEIIYGGDKTYFKECEMPIYEKMYIELNKKK